jgi:hypothetical protein
MPYPRTCALCGRSDQPLRADGPVGALLCPGCRRLPSLRPSITAARLARFEAAEARAAGRLPGDVDAMIAAGELVKLASLGCCIGCSLPILPTHGAGVVDGYPVHLACMPLPAPAPGNLGAELAALCARAGLMREHGAPEIERLRLGRILRDLAGAPGAPSAQASAARRHADELDPPTPRGEERP